MRSADCQGKRCQDNQGIFRFYRPFKTQFGLQYDTRYRNPLEYPMAKGEKCRFLVWALNPSIGVEDIQTRTDYPYWNQAWRASQYFIKPAFPAKKVGFIIQSAINRGEHQLHIHIGRLYSGYREAIDALEQNPKITQNIMIRGHLFNARYVVNALGKGAFTGASPFDVAGRIIPSEDTIPEYAILTAIARNRKGIFVLAAKGIERDQLDYRAKQACRLALKR
jgi:CDP-diacylglycerol pyrophosphatase